MATASQRALPKAPAPTKQDADADPRLMSEHDMLGMMRLSGAAVSSADGKVSQSDCVCVALTSILHAGCFRGQEVRF